MMSKGGRNLIILGVVSVLITCATCGLSLYLYHASGDIYLDRSRPGFLPDEEETDSSVEKADFKFSEDGPITDKTLDEYLENLQKELDNIDAISDPFSAEPLSDETLGIPVPVVEE